MYVCKILILFDIRIVDTHKQKPQNFRRNTTKMMRQRQPPAVHMGLESESDASVKVRPVIRIPVTMTTTITTNRTAADEI